MADRTATIRFQAKGAKNVTNSFDQISRKILSDQAKLDRAERVYGQKKAGSAMGIDQPGMEKAQKSMIEAEKQMQTNISDIDFRATHSRLEVQQRLLERSFKESLAKVKGKEKAELAIRKAYQLESSKIVAAIKEQELKQTAAEMREMVKAQQEKHKISQMMVKEDLKRAEAASKQKIAMEKAEMAAIKAKAATLVNPNGGGGGGRGVGGRGGAYAPPAFGSMSDRFTAMFSVAGAAGNITGDQTTARNIGLAASGFLMGSPLFGAINATAIGISAAIGKIREETEKANKAAQQYADTVLSIGTAWSSLSSSLVKNSPFGSKMDAQSMQSEKEILKLRIELAELTKDRPSFTMPGHDESNLAISKKYQEILLRSNEGSLARGLSDEEFNRRLQEEKDLIRLKQYLNDNRPKTKGESQSAYDRYTQEELERSKLATEYAQSLRQADQSVRVSRSQADTAGNIYEKSWRDGSDIKVRMELEAKYNDATLQYGHALVARKRIEAQHAVDVMKLEQEQRERRSKANAQEHERVLAEREKYDQAISEQEMKTIQAEIRAGSEGYEQKNMLAEIYYAQSIAKAKNHSEEMVDLVKRQNAAMREEERILGRQRIVNAMATFDAESALVQFRKNMGEFGGTSAQRKKISDEMLIGNYTRGIENDKLNLALKRNEITKTEADVQRMMAKDIRSRMSGPEGEQVRRAIRESAAIRKELRTQDAYDQIEALKKAENQRGSLTVGQFDAGGFNAKYINFSRLNQEGQMDKLREADQLKRIADILARIEQAGPLS